MRKLRYQVRASAIVRRGALTVYAWTVLKASLRGLFKAYGEVLDVVAHSNLRMRGQAFVSFESADVAKKALKEVKGFPLYSKPMVSLRALCVKCGCQCGVRQQISFARTRSDAVVKKLDAARFEEHKAHRIEQKSGWMVFCVPFAGSNPLTESTRYTNPIKRKYRARKMAAECEPFPLYLSESR